MIAIWPRGCNPVGVENDNASNPRVRGVPRPWALGFYAVGVAVLITTHYSPTHSHPLLPQLRLPAQDVVIMLGKTVGFVADVLQQAESEGVP